MSSPGANNRLAKARRLQLVRDLGGICFDCFETDEAKLTIDHKVPRTYSLRKLSSDQRVRTYEREARKGKLEVRCDECNKRKGNKVIHEDQAKVEAY